MISMAFWDAFGGFTFADFSPKKIPVALVVMISPSLIESSMFFFSIKATRFYCIYFKTYGIVLLVDPVFH